MSISGSRYDHPPFDPIPTDDISVAPEIPSTPDAGRSAETLLDDAVRFAAEAGTRGVFVTLEIWPHMIHAWHLWNARLEAGRQALGNAGAFLQRYL